MDDLLQSPKQQADYKEACQMQDAIASAEGAESTAARFDRLGDYLDSPSRAARCRELAAQIREEDAKQRRQRQQQEQEEAEAKAAAKRAAKKEKTRTILITTVSVVAGLALALVLIGFLVNHFDRKASLQQAEDLLSSGNYEEAVVAFSNLGETERVPQILAAQAEALLAEGDDYQACRILKSLYEDYGKTEALDRYCDVLYTKGTSLMSSGAYASAASCFEDVGDYLDAPQLAKKTHHLQGCAELESGKLEYALTSFQKAGDYENSADYATYCQARILAEKNLFTAEETLRQLPEEFLDVSTLLGWIDSFQAWNKIFVLTEFSSSNSNDTPLYHSATVHIRYLYDLSDDAPYLSVVVAAWKGEDATGRNNVYKDYEDTLTAETLQNGRFSYVSGYTDLDFWDEVSVSSSEIVIREYEKKHSFTEEVVYRYTAP